MEQMNEAILDKKVKIWEDQLLDLGKRNKMISFRESKRATLRILKPGFDELYQQIVAEEQELTFQKTIDRDSDVRVYSILSLLDKLSCPMEVNIGDIRAEGTLPEIQKTLKHLRAKARLAMDEQGTNILYLVFGFIEWHEKGSRNDTWIKSPLILVPVTLMLPSLNAQYSLKKHEDEVVVNPTLAYLFKRDYGITLPEFDSDKDTLDDFMQEMETLVDERGWRIVRACSMGLVSFLKISMYHDLIRNEAQLKNNPIIRAFAGERMEVDAADEFDHDACRSVDSFQVLNADSSQQDAIALSQKGISFVMQGPPGTGKSQTIANMIAQAMADGKKVLFVSEKMAALDVVYRRLTDVHLADFCLSLHSHKANKKEILNQLGANLSLQRIKVKDEEIAKLTRLDVLREQLKAYVHDIHQTIMPLEMSLYEVYGAILELGSLPDVAIHRTDIDKLSKDDVNRLALLIMDLEKEQNVLGPQWYKNPWQGIQTSYLEVSPKRALQSKLQDEIRILSALEACKLVDKTLADILSADTLDAFWMLYEHACHCSQIPNEWFHRTTEQEEQLVHRLRDQKQIIDTLTQGLADKYSREFFALSGRAVAAQLTSNMAAYRKVLRNEASEDALFELLEEDRQQTSALKELCQRLLAARNELSHVYKLPMRSDCTDIEEILSICEMLLEKRTLTPWYFSEGNVSPLMQYAAELQDRLAAFVEQKRHLCTRYAEEILACDGAEMLLQRLCVAEEALSGLVDPTHLGYSDLCAIVAVDPALFQRVEAALEQETFQRMESRYGLPRPVDLEETQSQISAMERAQQNTVVSSWQSKDAREKAKVLLQDIVSRTEKLAEDKKHLQMFFQQFGMTVEVDGLAEGDVVKLQRADERIPEANAIVSCCNSDEAYHLLDTIDQNKERYAMAGKEIDVLRAEYGIQDSFDIVQLLAALQDRHDAVTVSKPCSAWATSRADAAALLEQLMTGARELKEEQDRLLEICEESVFALDYAGMLNRFKAEYTSFFKIFKSSYRNDRKQIRLVFKEVRKKISDEEIIALLQSLRQYNEGMDQYQSLAAQVEQLLGVQAYDIAFDWKTIKERLDAFAFVSDIFQDDAAAYRFIMEECWSTLYDKLSDYDALYTWFNENAEARGYYAGLYTGVDTDTARIRDVLTHAQTMCTLFTSPDQYLAYMTTAEAASAKAAEQCAADIVNARNWFAAKTDEIETYTGIGYVEGSDPWQGVFSQLACYESIVSTVGETTGYALVSHYDSDRAAMDGHLDALVEITKILDCAKAVCHVAADTQDICTMDMKRLMTEIHTITSTAACLQSIYDTIAKYCPDAYSELSIEAIKVDLKAVLLYQSTRDELCEMSEDARAKLGEDYRGIATDWDMIRNNIVFCNKVSQLLSGAVSQELIAAFTEGTSLYSETQLSELRNAYKTARSIEAAYPSLSAHKDLEEKVQVLADIIPVLDEISNAKTTISAAAYAADTYSGIVEDLNRLAQIQDTQNAFDESLAEAGKILPTFALDAATDWNETTEIFNHLKQVKRAIQFDGMNPEVTQFVTNGIPDVPVTLYRDKIEKLMRSKQNITDITGLFANKAALEGYDLAKLTRRFRNCNEQFATMDAWIDLRDCKKACVDNGLEAFIAAAEDTYHPEGRLKDVFLKSFYYEWFEKICTGTESVSAFRVRTQEDRVEAFRELDAHQLPVNQMRIRERLIREMPSKHHFGRATDEISILLHELNKKRNIMPLRKLFRTIPNLLLKLKPCLMMSPLSVSYFLEAETYKFDMVIFDEASQILPQDAIGAIFRAKQVIIAGDSKQLPPTNFFAASTSNDADFDYEDEEEAITFDSILEEASNSLPNQSLLWHYRSRFEELISFSNQQIYQNNLITFPSSTVQEADTGVEYVYVKDGVYENRANRAEAKEIVRMVDEHMRKHPERSLGVIAFSESQQSVIEEEINLFRMQHPTQERFFDEDRDEPFFIKNLENVQGDERDTIIFSICYAKNAQGRMYMRFGPLGHQGGERRLNVAITRAKYNIKLVGSIFPEDIDLSKTRSEGVRMLRFYIAFAMQGSAVLPKREKKNSLYETDTFCEQVGKFLVSRGCTVKMNVGNSDYTIDIAVEHPKKPGQYVAGIECDGGSYYMARTVRDREHLRTAVLEQMGWKMYRVWSTEWIRNPEGEKERLMDFVSNALRSHGETIPDIIPPSGNVEEIVGTEVVNTDGAVREQDDTDPYDLPLYEEGVWWDKVTCRGEDNLSNIADMIHAVVRVEQPIHMELLYKRVGKGFTAGKATQGVRDTIDEAIRERMRGEVVIEDQFIRLTTLTTVQGRRSPLGEPDRTIDYISIPEIAAVMEKILVGAYGMERAVLCSETAKVFGFERTGVKIKQRTNEAVDFLIRTEKVSDYDDKIQLLEG